MFIVNFGLCVCALIHSLVVTRGTQTKLESQQITVELMAEKDDEEQFPICLERFKIYEDNDVLQGNEITKWYSLPKLSCHEWFMLLNILYIGTTVSVGEALFIVYYSVYVIQELHGTVIMGTLGVVVLSIAFMIGNLIVPQWLQSKIVADNHILKNKYFIMSICVALLILHQFVLYPMIPSLSMYWLFNFTTRLP